MRALGGFLIRHGVLLLVLVYVAVGLLLRDRLATFDLRALAPAAGVAHAGGAPGGAASQAPDPASAGPGPSAMPRTRRAAEGITYAGTRPSLGAGYRFRPLEDKGNAGPTPFPDAAPRDPRADPGSDVVEPGLDARLRSARQAFWDGDTAAAAERYRAAARAFPSEPDAFGELGNVYYQLGRMDEAFDAYADAARLLMDRGDRSAVDGLIRALEEADSPRTGRLRLRLQQPPGAPEPPGSGAFQPRDGPTFPPSGG
jgi:hypothetical protein